jgi:soluble lytic murein transglycosylase-like protein
VVLGAVVLVAGPIVAGTLTTTTPAAHVAAVPASAPLSAGEPTVRVVQRPMMLRLRIAPPPAATPAPAPKVAAPAPRRVAAPVGVPASKQAIVAIIMAAAARWGVDGNWMVSIARCESSLNPHAVNPRGPYDGLFQFLPSTFYHNGGTNIWDPADQANITAKMLAHGQAHQWSCA